MHITGGLGPTWAHEGFSFDYDLPNEGAYLETCAAVGLVFWAHRMLNADLDGQYADVMERALYNGVISGVSRDGRNFFYGNPLAVHPGLNGNGHFVRKGHHYRRSPWFGCACCPPNIARLIAQFPGFICSAGGATACVHLYARSEAAVEVAGQTVRIVQQTDYPWEETDYPWEEKVEIVVHPDRPAAWTLNLRIPGWCHSARLKVNGRGVRLSPITRKGYAAVRRAWREGDTVELTLPMPPERVEAHPAVRQDGGRGALQRGPVVYCLEETDNGPRLNDIALPDRARVRVLRNGVLGGAPILVFQGRRRSLKGWEDALYRTQTSPTEAVTMKAVPYFLWANRRPGEMLVWVRRA